MKKYFFPLFFFFIFLACEKKQPQNIQEEPVSKVYKKADTLDLSYDYLYDRMLGMLVGSAIGDAMGAPTEMWPRENMMVEYGYISNLDTMVRAPSPEGTWEYNLPAGGTTDDTRWKALTIHFIQTQNDQKLAAEDFAQHIVDTYLQHIQQLKETDSFSPEPFEIEARKMAWLQEWALVAKPLLNNDWQSYHTRLQQFYGGEMTCAGMLYAPVIGATYPANPLMAYQNAYNLSIFDIGYAKDLTGLLAAMVAEAIQPSANLQSILNVSRDIDPQDFFKSRLTGRAAYRIYRSAKYIVNEAEKHKNDTSDFKIPSSYQGDTATYIQFNKAFALLDEQKQDLPFHPGEIQLVNLTALMISKLDFRLALEFIINYGRDNDTTGAITGAILGAYWGFEKLPEDLKEMVITTNKEKLKIDLEDLARQLTDKVVALHS